MNKPKSSEGKGIKQLQDKVEREFDNKFVCQPDIDLDKVVAKLVGDTAYCWLPEAIKSFISSKLKEAYNAGREENSKNIVKILNEIHRDESDEADCIFNQTLEVVMKNIIDLSINQKES